MKFRDQVNTSRRPKYISPPTNPLEAAKKLRLELEEHAKATNELCISLPELWALQGLKILMAEQGMNFDRKQDCQRISYTIERRKSRFVGGPFHDEYQHVPRAAKVGDIVNAYGAATRVFQTKPGEFIDGNPCIVARYRVEANGTCRYIGDA